MHTVILAGLPKGSDKTDYILQKCTEAGASEIYFFASSRCVARIQGDADKKIARWQRIAEEAAKQSGRGVIPTVGFLPDLAEAFNKANATALPLFMYETGERETLREAVESAENIASAAILTGPEGGFEPFEAELARIMKLHICSMGPRRSPRSRRSCTPPAICKKLLSFLCIFHRIAREKALLFRGRSATIRSVKNICC